VMPNGSPGITTHLLAHPTLYASEAAVVLEMSV
jgi:hypothetical protein